MVRIKNGVLYDLITTQFTKRCHKNVRKIIKIENSGTSPKKIPENGRSNYQENTGHIPKGYPRIGHDNYQNKRTLRTS